jgi:hypothetical protein
MNISGRPSFLDSPFFVDEAGNWHMKEGAPQEEVDEFNDFMGCDESFEDLPLDLSKEK